MASDSMEKVVFVMHGGKKDVFSGVSGG